VAWKSWLHFDGTMFDDYFIVGITTPQGNYSYHYHKDHWGMFDVPVMDRAPEWDGHVPSDIDRLLSLTTKRSPARYGFCPVCGAIGIIRERRPDGNDTCARGHQYPSAQALTEQPVAC
jgi:hypothetical protein